MRRVVLPSEQQPAEAKTQPQSLQIVLASPEGTLTRINTSVVERAETRAKASTPERTLVTKANVDTVPSSKIALISTPVQNPIQASQDVLATLTTVNALLLLTTRPKFDKTTSEVVFESAKSSATHIEKVPFKESTSSPTLVFPSANEIKIDLLSASQ